jgi:CRISPR/Cas system-associated exonuclease Cas4 (RecB family)
MSDVKLPSVIERIKDSVSKEIKVNQPVSNWASKIGHPCARFLTHARLDWDKIPPISVEKKMLFDLGHVIERNVAKVYLEKAGFEIVEMDRPVQSETSGLLKRVKIHGKLDFICRDGKDGLEFPVEVKSAHPNTWSSVEAIEDMLFSKHFWMRQYPGQLMVYMLGKNYEVGLMLFINKVTAEPKAIWIHQDYTYAEELIKKAEFVNKCVDKGEYPERIPYDESLCGRCDFAKLCLGEIIRTEAEILTDDQLIEDLEEREKLKPFRARYEELDKSVKKRLKGIGKGVASDFMILGKEVERKPYSVEGGSYWKTDIQKIGGKSNGE